MITYYLLFLIPFLISINNNKNFNTKLLWFSTIFIYSFLIGFRHNVGADWHAYINHFTYTRFQTYSEILTGRDPGYYILNRIIYDFDLGIYGVNFICAILFMTGLYKLAKKEFNPWLVLTVAVPYTIIVVAMGYSRQAVALAFVMWAITYLRENNMFKFIILIIIAASFHKSAVLMIGLGIFANGGGKFLKIIAIGTISIGLYNIFLASHTDALVYNYIEKQQQSSGAFIRTFMNLIPAIILILFRKKWKELFDDFTFWFIIALLSILSFVIVGIASTAVDRMALYFIPIQLIVFSRLGILISDKINTAYTNICIGLYYLLVLYIWLNYASHSHSWLPYQNILIYDLW